MRKDYNKNKAIKSNTCYIFVHWHTGSWPKSQAIYFIVFYVHLPRSFLEKQGDNTYKQTNGRTDGRYQFYYLPASRSINIENKGLGLWSWPSVELMWYLYPVALVIMPYNITHYRTPPLRNLCMSGHDLFTFRSEEYRKRKQVMTWHGLRQRFPSGGVL